MSTVFINCQYVIVLIASRIYIGHKQHKMSRQILDTVYWLKCLGHVCKYTVSNLLNLQ